MLTASDKGVAGERVMRHILWRLDSQLFSVALVESWPSGPEAAYAGAARVGRQRLALFCVVAYVQAAATGKDPKAAVLE